MRFDDTLGALFLGHLFAILLFGITSLQTWIYFRRYPKDCFGLRCLMLLLWFIDCVHVALATHGVYTYLITHFTDVSASQRPIWSIAMIPVVSAISDLLVRGVFAHRLWRASRNSAMIYVVAALSLSITGSAIAFSIKSLSVSSWSEIQHFRWIGYFGLSTEIAVNVIITAAQVHYLLQFRNGVRFRSMDMVLHTLIVYCINACLITSIVSFMALITFILLPNTLLYIAIYFVLSKFYFNALLANLNARSSLKESLHNPDHGITEPPSVIGTLSTSTHVDSHGGSISNHSKHKQSVQNCMQLKDDRLSEIVQIDTAPKCTLPPEEARSLIGCAV